MCTGRAVDGNSSRQRAQFMSRRPRPVLYIARVGAHSIRRRRDICRRRSRRNGLPPRSLSRDPNTGMARAASAHAAIAAGRYWSIDGGPQRATCCGRAMSSTRGSAISSANWSRQPDLALPILYEDEALVMVDKPAGCARRRPASRRPRTQWPTHCSAAIRSSQASGARSKPVSSIVSTPRRRGCSARAHRATTGSGCAHSSAPAGRASCTSQRCAE